LTQTPIPTALLLGRRLLDVAVVGWGAEVDADDELVGVEGVVDGESAVDGEVAAEDVEEDSDATPAAVVDGATLIPLAFMPSTVGGAGPTVVLA
jgi:hypothetical protein